MPWDLIGQDFYLKEHVILHAIIEFIIGHDSCCLHEAHVVLHRQQFVFGIIPCIAVGEVTSPSRGFKMFVRVVLIVVLFALLSFVRSFAALDAVPTLSNYLRC